MITFIPLASSSSGCSYLVKAEGHAPLLIDAGLSFTELQRRVWGQGLTLSGLAGCLISHGHGDHAKAVPQLLKNGVNCWASEEVWREIGVAGHHRARTVRMAGVIKSWIITPFAAVHDSPGSLGFVCDLVSDGPRERLVYLTDSAWSPNTFEGVTIFALAANYSEEILKENVMAGTVHMEVAKRTLQSHPSIERVVEMLAANDLSQCREIHLLHLSDSNSHAEDFKRQVQAATGVPCYVAAK